MISADEALALVLDNVTTLGVERVALGAAFGRVLAEEIHSPRDIPGFDNSAMDGYAVRAADVASAAETHPIKLRVIETIAAGALPTRAISPGLCARIMTGAPVPEGADAIVPVERTRAAENSNAVEILAAVDRAAFVRPRGEDLRLGEAVMAPGKRLTPSDVGTLASLCRPIIDVYRRPRVALVATGDELVDIDRIPTGAQVVNSSAYALAAAIRQAGGEPIMLKIARDSSEEIRGRLIEALAFDMVLSTGGVSVGQFDYVKGALDELNMRTLFHGVAQRPGRPLKFGLIGGRPVFGLPGNPVSTMVCYYLYVHPALQQMGGRREKGLPRATVKCAVDIRTASNLTEFVRVRLERRADELWATPTGNQGSGILSSLARADALLIGPAGETTLHAGSQATVLLFDEEAGADTAPFFERRDHSH